MNANVRIDVLLLSCGLRFVAAQHTSARRRRPCCRDNWRQLTSRLPRLIETTEYASVYNRHHMPLFEFRCRGCGHQFEALVRGVAAPACPACESDDLERLISLFGVSSEGTQQLSLQSARRRNAKTIRDQQMADHEYRVKHEH
jgi:putative FmdB family regulatory protein